MEDWIKEHSEELDLVAEQYDNMGMLQGVMNYPGAVIELVFDHGMLVVDRDDATRVLAERQMTRIDEIGP